MSNSLEFFAEPYTTKRSGLGWYDVVFEETAILNVWGRGEAEQLASALNGAYNLGRSFELIRQGIQEE
jgi:hypothetical protein